MEINIMDYLDEEEIKEICIQEVRRLIKTKDETNLERIMVNSAYRNVFGIVDDLLPQGYSERIVENVNKIIDSSTSFSLFRWDYSTGHPTSLGAKIIEETVKSRKQDLINRINNAIDSEISRPDAEIYSEFVDRFMDNMYTGFKISFEKEEVK